MNAKPGTTIGGHRCFRDVLVRICAKIPPAHLAAELGVNVWTLYNYKNGRATFPVDLVAPLYITTCEQEIIDFVMAGTDLVAVPKPKPVTGDLIRELVRVRELLSDGTPKKRLAPDMMRLAGLLIAQARSE